MKSSASYPSEYDVQKAKEKKNNALSNYMQLTKYCLITIFNTVFHIPGVLNASLPDNVLLNSSLFPAVQKLASAFPSPVHRAPSRSADGSFAPWS